MPPRRAVVYTVPQLVNNRGSLPLKRSYKGVGVIRVASGTTDPTTYVDILRAMDAAHNVGNLATLEALRNKLLTPLEFLASVRANGAAKVLNIDHSVLLVDTVRCWLDRYHIKESTRRGYRSHLAGFFAHCKANDTLRDIANRLESYRKVCQKKNIHVSFNHCRIALLAFARSEYKKRSHVYLDLHEVEVLPVVRKLKNDAITVSEFLAFAKAMNETHAAIAWDLAYTGMRIGEFLGDDATWDVKRDRIDLTKVDAGQGNKGYSRTVMLPFPVVKSTRHIKAIRRAFKQARGKTGLTVTPHTARKCFAYWCSEAGIADVRIEAYSGRSAKTILDLYKRHEVEAHLADDARKFREYVENFRNPPPPPKRTIEVLVDTGLFVGSNPTCGF